jgi:hypothetical protein
MRLVLAIYKYTLTCGEMEALNAEIRQSRSFGSVNYVHEGFRIKGLYGSEYNLVLLKAFILLPWPNKPTMNQFGSDFHGAKLAVEHSFVQTGVLDV